MQCRNGFRLSLLILLLGLSACAPRFYQRSTIQVETGDDDGVQIHYGELDGCMFRQQVPVEYVVRRSRYTLRLHPVSSMDGAPSLELRLQGDDDPVLAFDGVDPQPPALYAEKGLRYLVDVAALHGRLDVSVLKGEQSIGHERFRLTPDKCRVLSPN